MKGWKDYKVTVVLPEGTHTVTIRATHKSMAEFVAKRRFPNATSVEAVKA